MGRDLRICLAMGGGVSLGAFSGSSLTESLKLLLLFGQDEDGNPYDDIIIDGMSGASAGAISLTILLKCLISYKPMLPLIGKDVNEDSLVEEIAKNYFSGSITDALNYPKIENLKALQAAQKLQYKLWVKEVDSNRLYGKKNNKDYKNNLNDSFGLLDRELLETLTRDYLMEMKGFDLSNIQMLNKDRVLFACSLTNLLPIEIETPRKDLSKLELNMLRSVGSQNHTELRVIDFVFNEDVIKNKPTDSRWLKFCKSPNGHTQFDISKKDSWATIASSALACGAFPIAFEPVLLKRYKEEFGGDNKFSQWPKSFNQIIKDIDNSKAKHDNFKENSFFAETGLPVIDYKSFNFPYIDGGTFNNEPIKEAFKIATFQDYGNFTDDYDRLVLFVDPIVRTDANHSFNQASFSPIRTKKYVAEATKETSKLTGSISSILGVLTNQGSIKEEHRIVDTRENFNLRDTVFSYLEQNPNIGDSITIEILKAAFEKIQANLFSNIISMGTRDPFVYFLNEIKRSCLEKTDSASKCLLIFREDLKKLKEKIDTGTIGKGDMKKAYETLKIDKDDIEGKNTFAQTVFKLIIDFSLNTDGKNPSAKRAAVLPINNEHEIINLPGSEIEAFAGFASFPAKEYSFQYGRLSSLLSLNEKGAFREGEAYLSNQNLKSVKKVISNEIHKVGFYNKENKYSKDLSKNLFKPSIERIKKLLIESGFQRWLLIKVPFLVTALAAPIYSVKLLWDSLFNKSSWRASNIINKLIEDGGDQVNYMKLSPITFSVLSPKELSRKLYVKCSDTKKIKTIKVYENPYIDASGKKRYQYLFQLFSVNYLKMSKINTMDKRLLTTNNVETEYIESMELSLEAKVEIPRGIDGNFDSKGLRMALQKSYRSLVKEIRLDRVNLPLISKAINDDSQSLHHSFKNINSHVNPLIEVNLEKLNEGWYFKEQTESLDKKL